MVDVAKMNKLENEAVEIIQNETRQKKKKNSEQKNQLVVEELQTAWYTRGKEAENIFEKS